MRCYCCGQENPDGTRFCGECGADQSKAPQPIPQPEPQPESVPQPEPAPQPAPQPIPPQAPWGAPQPVPQPVYVNQTVFTPGAAVPRIQLPTGRGLAKMIFLGLITCGIYNIVISSKMVTEMNITTSRYDGRRTMPFLAMCTVAPLTLGIYTFIWMHGLCSRMGDELRRRNIAYSFGAADYWLWNLLGSLILVGPFIFLHKQMKALNLINGDFNRKG